MLAFVGCAGDVSTIDRTQPNALDKTMFEGIWYHRATVVSASPESGETEGITSRTSKLRWEIQENLLIGYRSYEVIPYAEGLTDEGRDFFGGPEVAYPIESHFDIQRDYNTTTGVESNVIVENTTDRPWNERRYMRVNWSQNVVGTRTGFLIGWANYPSAYLQGAPQYYVQSHEPDNPDRPIITRDYFDVTNIYEIEPDGYFCAMMEWSNAIERCGTGKVKVRLSFKKIDPTDDYESLYYPDVVELKDNEGNALVLNGEGRSCDSFRDPGECFVQTWPYDAAFGNFRIQRVAFDRERFLTRSGRIYAAGRFDLWENSYKDDDGAMIPYEQRQAKPIIYYGNTNFPEDMIEPAKRLAASWNIPFLETVAMLQGDKDDSGRPNVGSTRQRIGFDMFQFVQNDCNVENIKAYATANGYQDVVAGLIGNIDRVERGNLERVCAAVQYADLQAGKTFDATDASKRAFQWQRTGDLRYNFQNYVDPLNYYGPWGVAQFAQDPETGEFFSNTANYFGTSGDLVSQQQVDVLQWLNGDLSEEELFRGDFTRNSVVSRRSAANTNVRDAVRSALQGHMDRMVEEGSDMLFRETTADAEERRFEKMFKGTDIERELLLNDELLRSFAGPSLYQPYNAPADSASARLDDVLALVPGDVNEAAIDAASPVSWGTTPQSNFYMKMVEDLGSRGFEMADFWDPTTSGLADSMKGTSRENIVQFLRVEMYAAVQAHEVGHTVGLRHNFEASIDALNYHPDFWYKEDANGTVTQYWNNPAAPGNANRGAEYKYASIMDYGFNVPLEGLHGIGLYDKAAIRFMYGQLVDVWDPKTVSIPDPRKYGSFARRCGFNDGFYGMPGLLYWLGPKAIPQVMSASPVVENDEVCVPVATKTDNRGRACLDDPNTELDESAPVVNYDAETRCDSALDTHYRKLVADAEAYVQNANWVSECGLTIDALNELFEKIAKLYPDTTTEDGRLASLDSVRRINAGRVPVPVSQLMSQKIQSLLNTPEYDIPDTNDDESLNCYDDDGDGEVDDKGFNWGSMLTTVEYDYCSDYYAGYSNPRCQRWDTGWDFLESTEAHINAYDRDYVFDHFRRDRSTPWGSGRGYMARLEARRLFHMSNVFRYYLYSRRSAFDAPLYVDWAQAAFKGLNMLERILQTPEPGRYCLNNAGTEYEIDVTGERTDCREAMEIGLGYGEGKYLDTTWTNEYHYKPNRIGAYYDKLSAIRQLTASSGIFVRDVADLFDRRAFSLGYMRAFEDPMIQRFNALITGDSTGYESVVESDDNGKFVRYMPFLDEALSYGVCTQETEAMVCTRPNTSCNAAPNQTGVCVGGSVRDSLADLPRIKPSWSWSLQFLSLGYAMANLSSINDYAPEFYRFTKIAIKDTPEDITYGPTVVMAEFTDPETLITYRAPTVRAQPPPDFILPHGSYYGDRFHRTLGKARNWDIGADLLRKAETFKTEVYEPRQTACPDLSQNTAACQSFREARRTMNEMVGYIDIVRRFNRQAEFN
jgi:hypothetical protein